MWGNWLLLRRQCEQQAEEVDTMLWFLVYGVSCDGLCASPPKQKKAPIKNPLVLGILWRVLGGEIGIAAAHHLQTIFLGESVVRWEGEKMGGGGRDLGRSSSAHVSSI